MVRPMKQAINVLLSILAPFASVPTGWAIYAGVTERPAFPIWEPAAIIGAVAVIATTAAAALLVVDIMKQNQEAQTDDERKMNLSVWYAWAVLIGCILGEITLSLLIVVIPRALSFGVLAFPMMTLAGVFAFALRIALGDRLQQRDALRAKIAKDTADRQAKQDAEDAERKAEEKAERARMRELRRTTREAKRTAMQVQPEIPAPVTQSVAPASKYPRECGVNGCTYVLKNAQSVGGHMKAKHPVALGIFEPVQKEQAAK